LTERGNAMSNKTEAFSFATSTKGLNAPVPSSSDAYMRFYKEQCKAMDGKYTSLMSKCSMKDFRRKVMDLAWKKKFGEIKTLVKSKIQLFRDPRSGCVPKLITEFSGASPNFVGCSCALYLSALLNENYKVKFSYMGRFNLFSPNVKLRDSPRAYVHSNSGNMAHWHTYSAAAPMRYQLTRYRVDEGNSTGYLNWPVCKMEVNVNMMGCESSPQVRHAIPKCSCTGGLTGRVVTTRQLTVQPSNDKIDDADCKKWFMVQDAVARISFAGYHVFTYLGHQALLKSRISGGRTGSQGGCL
jgi:hypothetical protein